MQRGVRAFSCIEISQWADVKSYKTTIVHWHRVGKIVEFGEIAQADELSFCVRLL